MQPIRIYDMPPCRMVASSVGMFGEPALEVFDTWLTKQPRSMFPRDFLTFDDSDPVHPGFRWYFMYEDGMVLPEGAQVVDLPGGMYAVATGIDQQTDKADMDAAVAAFLTQHKLEPDDTRRELGNIITSPAVRVVLGYEQMDYYYPVRSMK
ncbi:MAG: AraC family transcriptional regulator [Clostridia bacterium]|nr:AraC family transcriptional regulator [Clostridia bacterium]